MKRIKKLGFIESKLVLKGNDLKSRKEYEAFIEKYPGLPLSKNPESKFHKSGEWQGWDDFLNTGKIQPIRIKKLSYNDGKKLARKLGIKTSIEYFFLKRQGKLPLTLPYKPQSTWKNDWEGWHKFLGTKPTTQHRQWASYEKAKKWARDNNIKTQIQWLRAKRPLDIPSDPARIYK